MLTVRCTCALRLPPKITLYNCIIVDMLFNIVGHKIDENGESWNCLVQKRRGDRFFMVVLK